MLCFSFSPHLCSTLHHTQLITCLHSRWLAGRLQDLAPLRDWFISAFPLRLWGDFLLCSDRVGSYDPASDSLMNRDFLHCQTGFCADAVWICTCWTLPRHFPVSATNDISVPTNCPCMPFVVQLVASMGTRLLCSCPSVQAFIRQCHHTWARSKKPLLLSSRPCKVWLSTQELTLGVESKNLASKFTGPFEIQALIHLTFRISKATSVQESPLVPAGPTPARLCASLMGAQSTLSGGEATSMWSTLIQKRGHGSLPASSLIPTSFPASIGSTRISLPRQLCHSGAPPLPFCASLSIDSSSMASLTGALYGPVTDEHWCFSTLIGVDCTMLRKSRGKASI